MNTSAVNILLIGAGGQMGREIVLAASRAETNGRRTKVIGGITAKDDPAFGKQIEGIAHPLSASWDSAYKGANVVIDFSTPQGTQIAAQIAARERVPLLVGTTGLGDIEMKLIAAAAELVPVIQTSNTSVGVNALLEVVTHAAQLLGKEFDIEILETHHRRKKDAPSGTAISLACAVGEQRGKSYPNGFTLSRVGDSPRQLGEIGVQTLRGGDVAGEHSVIFFGDGERVELTHRATSRAIFANGAVRAATWLVDAAARGERGMFRMTDVLRNQEERGR